MNVLISNGEASEANLLIELLHKIDNQIHILGTTSSYEETMLFCAHHSDEIDLVFCATQMNGLSTFDIASQTEIQHKFIFTSNSKEDAYDAIKTNCIDFLLEPFDLTDVSLAIKRAKAIINASQTNEKRIKKRFIIKFGDKIQYRNPDEIAYFYADGKMAFMITRQPTRKYIIDYTLDELEKKLLDPSDFYRINRKFIVHIDAIEEARQYVNSRLKLLLNPPADFDMIVSREKVQDFKNWLNL